jgi:probable HAF family extracellular repeat protein
MKSRVLADEIGMTFFVAVAVMLALIAAAAPCDAQHSGRPSTGAPGAPPRGQSSTGRVSASVDDAERDVRYTVTQVGVLPNEQGSFLPITGSINNSGVVAGYSFNGAFAASDNFFLTAVGFIGEHGRLEALPLLSGWPGAEAFGLNDHEQVFGVANKACNGCNVGSFGTIDPNIVQTPVLWDSGRPINLGALLPNSGAQAFGMNNRGEVVGGSYSFDLNVETPFVWCRGQMKALPLLPDAVGGEADGINDPGQVTGSLDFGSTPPPGTGEFHSVLWTPNEGSYVVVDLGNFGGDSGTGEHVHNRGQVVGWATDAAGNLHAYLWDGGPLQDLGLLPGGTFSAANGINQRGQIVGTADRADGNQVTFLWEDGLMTDLNDLVPVGTPLLTYPGGINDHGEIAASAFLADGSVIGFVLTPIQ